jgi:hypothetical protein
MRTENFDQALLEFLESFEEVFHNDWTYTKEMLGIHEETGEPGQIAQQLDLEPLYMISPEGTFIEPKVADEIEDWGNRGRLLEKYRKLKLLVVNQKFRAER